MILFLPLLDKFHGPHNTFVAGMSMSQKQQCVAQKSPMRCVNLVASLVMAAAQLPVLLEHSHVYATCVFAVACCLLRACHYALLLDPQDFAAFCVLHACKLMLWPW